MNNSQEPSKSISGNNRGARTKIQNEDGTTNIIVPGQYGTGVGGRSQNRMIANKKQSAHIVEQPYNNMDQNKIRQVGNSRSSNAQQTNYDPKSKKNPHKAGGVASKNDNRSSSAMAVQGDDKYNKQLASNGFNHRQQNVSPQPMLGTNNILKPMSSSGNGGRSYKPAQNAGKMMQANNSQQFNGAINHSKSQMQMLSNSPQKGQNNHFENRTKSQSQIGNNNQLANQNNLNLINSQNSQSYQLLTHGAKNGADMHAQQTLMQRRIKNHNQQFIGDMKQSSKFTNQSGPTRGAKQNLNNNSKAVDKQKESSQQQMKSNTQKIQDDMNANAYKQLNNIPNVGAHNSFLPNIKSRNPKGQLYGQNSHNTILQAGQIVSQNSINKQNIQQNYGPAINLNHSTNGLKIDPTSQAPGPIHEMPQIQSTPSGTRISARGEDNGNISPNSTALMKQKKRSQNEIGKSQDLKKQNMASSKGQIQPNNTIQMRKTSNVSTQNANNPYNFNGQATNTNLTTSQNSTSQLKMDNNQRPQAPGNGQSSGNSRNQMRSRNAIINKTANTLNNTTDKNSQAINNVRVNPQKTLNPYNEKRIESGKSGNQYKNHKVVGEQSPNKTINQSQGSNMHPVGQGRSRNDFSKSPGHQSQKMDDSYSKSKAKDTASSQNVSRINFYQPTKNYMQVGASSSLPMFQNSKTANKKFGVVKSFAANTHVGLVRKANEDRIAIILNVIQPQQKEPKMPDDQWPKIQIFAVYDGHGGNQCAEYLKEHLHNNIILQPDFPKNVQSAIFKGTKSTDNTYINKMYQELQATQKMQNCKSGSCANLVMTFNDDLYVINVGDSRAIGSKNNGAVALDLSEDHKPGEESEFRRIEAAGGHVYQTHSVINAQGQPCLQQIRVDKPPNDKYTMDNPLIGPYRVFPGRLSVCRTMGDLEAKQPQLGGNPDVVVCTPEINYQKDGCKKLDYVLTCSDGIFDKISTQQVHDIIWTVISYYIGDKSKTVHQIIGHAVDEVLHASARWNTLDNISVVMIAFEPLVSLIDNYRNPQVHQSQTMSNIEIAQGQQADFPPAPVAVSRSRNNMNNLKQLTTGTGESQKLTRSSEVTRSSEYLNGDGQQSMGDEKSNKGGNSNQQTRFNTIEQGNSIAHH